MSGDLGPLRPLAPDLIYPEFANADRSPYQAVHAYLPHVSRRGIIPEVVLDRHWVTLYFTV